MIDLHTHTNESDGQYTPEEQVDKALQVGLTALAITDHDTITGCNRAVEWAKIRNSALTPEKQIEIIPGIEIGCSEDKKGWVDIHILGLFVNPNHKEIVQFSERVRKERIEQKKIMVKKLQDSGFDIRFEEVIKIAGHSFGRPHLAKILVQKYPQKFPDVHSVFEQLLGTGKPAYVPRRYINMKDAVNLIKNTGGIPILAHPGIYDLNAVLSLIEYFMACGGQGLETFYPYHLINGISLEESNEKNSFFREFAEKNHLAQSGGSDFHGDIRKSVCLGERNIPDRLTIELKKQLTKQKK